MTMMTTDQVATLAAHPQRHHLRAQAVLDHQSQAGEIPAHLSDVPHVRRG